MSPNEFCTESLCKWNSVHVTSHPYLQTRWGKDLSPDETSVNLELGQRVYAMEHLCHDSHSCSSTTGPWAPKASWSLKFRKNSLQIDVSVTLLCLKSSCLWGGLKTNHFPFLAEKVEILFFFPWVKSSRSLVGRHNEWTWQLFKFCFLHWRKEFVLVSELLLEMRKREAKLGFVIIRHVTAFS